MAAKRFIFHHAFGRCRASSGEKKVGKGVCPAHPGVRTGPGLKSLCGSGGGQFRFPSVSFGKQD